MGFEDAARFMGIGLIAWLSLLAVLIAYRMLTGAIWTRGILSNAQEDGTSHIDMERLQLLIIFLVSVAFYIKTGLAALGQPGTLTIMPEPPELFPELLLASNAIYLAGKYGRKIQKGDTP